MNEYDLMDHVMLPNSKELVRQTVSGMLAGAATEIQEAKDKYESRPPPHEAGYQPKDEHYMCLQLVNLCNALVKNFEPSNRPTFFDTTKVTLPSLHADSHSTKPDITATRPGITTMPKSWNEPGLTGELENDLDAMDKATDAGSRGSVQLARSGRNLIMMGRCYSFTLALFQHHNARIVCFDRTGFLVSTVFDWLDGEVLATFLYRLYNPPGHPGCMDGDDFSVSPLSPMAKPFIYAQLCNDGFYASMFSTMETALGKSLRFMAARRRGDKQELVHCITIGKVIYQSDGLFSRATRVYRVVIEEDLEPGSHDAPTVYAMKDSWREASRRAEVDFYDLIKEHCVREGINMDEEGIVQCHGSVDLSEDGFLSPEDAHAQRSRLLQDGPDARRVRHHTRTLITPVGRPLKQFKRTRDLAVAFRDAIYHHQIAYEAGVLHRDVSEGNVMFIENIPDDQPQRGFLLDYDYADVHIGWQRGLRADFPAPG
ncbi:Pkinase-fungal domain-containing protein [Mycena chlorophos]|uniref:Pkinase-fungal domain-containing protein n=1 Tax=Mycena chlorophos TaxID=658473 RepID=A0A8H6SE29_MYCCL|nr:Pkinase-fungal domain-containing protein [Mycena chlorophos]